MGHLTIRHTHSLKTLGLSLTVGGGAYAALSLGAKALMKHMPELIERTVEHAPKALKELPALAVKHVPSLQRMSPGLLQVVGFLTFAVCSYIYFAKTSLENKVKSILSHDNPVAALRSLFVKGVRLDEAFINGLERRVGNKLRRTCANVIENEGNKYKHCGREIKPEEIKFDNESIAVSTEASKHFNPVFPGFIASDPMYWLGNRATLNFVINLFEKEEAPSNEETRLLRAIIRGASGEDAYKTVVQKGDVLWIYNVARNLRNSIQSIETEGANAPIYELEVPIEAASAEHLPKVKGLLALYLSFAQKGAFEGEGYENAVQVFLQLAKMAGTTLANGELTKDLQESLEVAFDALGIQETLRLYTLYANHIDSFEEVAAAQQAAKVPFLDFALNYRLIDIYKHEKDQVGVEDNYKATTHPLIQSYFEAHDQDDLQQQSSEGLTEALKFSKDVYLSTCRQTHVKKQVSGWLNELTSSNINRSLLEVVLSKACIPKNLEDDLALARPDEWSDGDGWLCNLDNALALSNTPQGLPIPEDKLNELKGYFSGLNQVDLVKSLLLVEAHRVLQLVLLPECKERWLDEEMKSYLADSFQASTDTKLSDETLLAVALDAVIPDNKGDYLELNEQIEANIIDVIAYLLDKRYMHEGFETEGANPNGITERALVELAGHMEDGHNELFETCQEQLKKRFTETKFDHHLAPKQRENDKETSKPDGVSLLHLFSLNADVEGLRVFNQFCPSIAKEQFNKSVLVNRSPSDPKISNLKTAERNPLAIALRPFIEEQDDLDRAGAFLRELLLIDFNKLDVPIDVFHKEAFCKFFAELDKGIYIGTQFFVLSSVIGHHVSKKEITLPKGYSAAIAYDQFLQLKDTDQSEVIKEQVSVLKNKYPELAKAFNPQGEVASALEPASA